jgi:hyperosmotically inducible protein
MAARSQLGLRPQWDRRRHSGNRDRPVFAGAPVIGSGYQIKGESMTNITRKLAAFASVLLIATTLGCASTRTQEGTGEYVDDTVITTKVKAAILNEPTLKSAEINVETFKGVVQLSGFVSSQAAESKAVEVARTVGGVKSVKNDMRLK